VSWAALFPGQGAQFVGMGRAVAMAHAGARAVFDEADAVLGYPLSRLIWEGPEDALRDTEVQQPAILTVSVAVWTALAPDPPPVAAVGLSLGEYSALVAAGLLPFADAVRIARIRGRAMQTAVPRGQGGMTAVLGLSEEEVQALCAKARAVGWVEPANFNAPGQIVVSGEVAALEALEAEARARRAKAVRLAVSAPFHSRLLEPAAAPVAAALDEARWGTTARFPVLANVDGYPVRDAEAARPRLVEQVYRPVRFEQAVRSLLANGVERFVEIGPGQSLAAMVKKIHRGARVVSVEAPEAFAAALELVRG
jgi:[acyl-carrier-protein] S-malonyltransferase